MKVLLPKRSKKNPTAVYLDEGGRHSVSWLSGQRFGLDGLEIFALISVVPKAIIIVRLKTKVAALAERINIFAGPQEMRGRGTASDC